MFNSLHMSLTLEWYTSITLSMWLLVARTSQKSIFKSSFTSKLIHYSHKNYPHMYDEEVEVCTNRNGLKGNMKLPCTQEKFASKRIPGASVSVEPHTKWTCSKKCVTTKSSNSPPNVKSSCSITPGVVTQQLLMRAGDVETNPGPLSKFGTIRARESGQEAIRQTTSSCHIIIASCLFLWYTQFLALQLEIRVTHTNSGAGGKVRILIIGAFHTLISHKFTCSCNNV